MGYQIPDEVLSQEEQNLITETMNIVRSGDTNKLLMLRARVCSEADIACLKSKDGFTPLHVAVLYDHPRIVEYLIRAGADINALDGKFLRTPLQWAIIKSLDMDNHDTVRLLIQAYEIQEKNETESKHNNMLN